MQRQHRIRRGARSQAAVSLASPSALRGLLPLGEWEQNTVRTNWQAQRSSWAGLSPGEWALDSKACGASEGKNVSQSRHLHLPHSVPVALLWTDCSLLHLRPLPMSAERGGNKEIPCYALQRFPEKQPYPCVWDEVGQNQCAAFTQGWDPSGAKDEERCWLMQDLPVTDGAPSGGLPGRSLPLREPFSLFWTWTRESLKGVRYLFQELLGPLSASALRPTQSWGTQVDIQHRKRLIKLQGHLSKFNKLWLMNRERAKGRDKDHPG